MAARRRTCLLGGGRPRRRRRPAANSGGCRPGDEVLTAMLVEAAGSVGRMKGANYLSAQHARLTARRGVGRAQVAVAHSILVSA